VIVSFRMYEKFRSNDTVNLFNVTRVRICCPGRADASSKEA
jgi:hypothetical protein